MGRHNRYSCTHAWFFIAFLSLFSFNAIARQITPDLNALPLRKQCTKTLKKHGYWTLKGHRKSICEGARHQSGVDALGIVARQGLKINDTLLTAVLSIAHPVGVRCMDTELNFGRMDLARRVDICKRVTNAYALNAVAGAAQQDKLGESSLTALLEIGTEKALTLAQSYLRQAQHLDPAMIRLCKSEPRPEGYAFLLSLREAAAGLTEEDFAVLVRMTKATPKACVKAIGEHRSLSANDVTLCQDLRTDEELAALTLLLERQLNVTAPLLAALSRPATQFSRPCIVSFLDYGYAHSNLQWLDACQKLDNPWAQRSIIALAKHRASLSDQALTALLNINAEATELCVGNLLSEGYSFTDAEQISVCHQLQHTADLDAFRALTHSKARFNQHDFRRFLKSYQQPLSRPCIAAFLTKGINVFADRHLDFCSQIPSAATGNLIAQVIANENPTTDLLEGLISIQDPQALRCLRAFASHHYPLSEGQRFEMCQHELDDEFLTALEQLTATEQPFDENILLSGVTAERTCQLLWGDIASLGIEKLAYREVYEAESSCYDALLFALAQNQAPTVTSKRQQLISQLKFAKALFDIRETFISNAKSGLQNSVWYYTTDGAEGAFHAELANVTGANQFDVFTMEQRLNYIHNAMIWGFTKAKRDGKIDLYFSKAFDPTRYCIDARTEAMVDFLKLQENGYDPLEDASSRDALINKLLEIHQQDCINQGSEMSATSIGRFLKPYVGKVFQGETLGSTFIADCIAQAQLLAII